MHSWMWLNTISSCFSHIPKRTRTCHVCNGPHPKLMSRWEFRLIPCRAVSSPHHYECLSQRSTQVMRTSNSSMAGCIRCCDGWRLTILQDQSTSGNASRSQPCISAKKPRHGYESLRLRKKDSFIHPGSAKKLRPHNGFIEHHVNYFTDSCDKRDKTPDGLRHEQYETVDKNLCTVYHIHSIECI